LLKSEYFNRKKITYMRKLVFSIMFLFIVVYGNSQVISNVDFDKINKNVGDTFSTYFYPKLIDRLLKNDTTILPDEYSHLYFGNALYEKYNPYGRSDKFDEFKSKIKEQDYTGAGLIGKEILKENPVNIEMLYYLLICYDKQGVIDTARMYAKHFFSFLNVIYESGDGKSIQTAFVVMCVDDEYQILDDLGLESTGQALLDGPTDRLTINTKGQKVSKGQNKIKELYFNVTKPFEQMSKMFKE
jgi:hypothetical protein